MNRAILKKGAFKLSYLFVGIIFACSALTGILPQTPLSFAIVLSCVGLLFTNDIYLAYPFMIFYNELYGTVLGLSVYRIFSFLFLASVLFKVTRQTKVDTKKLLPIAVYFLYCIAVLGPFNVQRAIFAFVDVICVALFTGQLMSKVKIKRFFTVYTFVCFVAFLTGIVVGNSMDYSSYYFETGRFMATFEDPNYMGMFYTIAIFAIISLKLFSPKLRVLIVILLYAIILSSLSITAIVLNSILWMAYLYMAKKINLKTLVIIICVIGILVGLYNYGLTNPDAPVLGALSHRLEEKIIQLDGGNIDDATTGRTDLSKQHFEYFMAQPFFKKLVGGTSVNSSYIVEELGMAAHNEYVDMLLNVGILGAIILLGYMLIKTVEYFKAYRRTNDAHYLCLLMYKFTWIAYAMSLTLFIDHRFLLPFFI